MVHGSCASAGDCTTTSQATQLVIERACCLGQALKDRLCVYKRKVTCFNLPLPSYSMLRRQWAKGDMANVAKDTRSCLRPSITSPWGVTSHIRSTLRREQSTKTETDATCLRHNLQALARPLPLTQLTRLDSLFAALSNAALAQKGTSTAPQ